MDYRVDTSIVNRIRRVSTKYDTKYWREMCAKKEFPCDYRNDLAREGLLGLVVGKKWGGMEKSLVDLCLATQETAERYSGLGSYLFLSGCLVSTIFSRSNEVQKEEILPKLVNGELKISIALSEESAGFDSSAIDTTAHKSGDGYVINGAKSFVNAVDISDYLVLFARTKSVEKESHKSRGMTMFLVPAKSPSIKTTERSKLGMDFIKNFQITIRDLKVREADVVGEVDNAWYAAVDSFNMDRVATAASLVGTGKLALEQASDYASKRTVFGRAVGSNQGIQFPLSEAMAQLLTAEVMMLKAASIQSKGEAFTNAANYALYESSCAASYATDRALQTFGGHGYFADYDVERYWRDVRVHKLHPISEELLLSAIGHRVLGLPKSY